MICIYYFKRDIFVSRIIYPRLNVFMWIFVEFIHQYFGRLIQVHGDLHFTDLVYLV